jgi:hypothetical protein
MELRSLSLGVLIRKGYQDTHRGGGLKGLQLDRLLEKT